MSSKIAIMGAMAEEIEPLLDKVENIKKIEYAKNIYYEATYRGREVVIANSKIGKVFASLTATILIEKFGCDKLLFSGVAGAINPDLKIGDLIIASHLCQHDLDITVFGRPFGYVPGSQVYIPTDKRLRDIAKEIAKDRGLEVKEGIIATGDQFVSSKERKDFILSTFNADALEMEGASVALICDALEVPSFILRAITDSADGSADIESDIFLESSAKISADFILDMVEKIE